MRRSLKTLLVLGALAFVAAGVTLVLLQHPEGPRPLTTPFRLAGVTLVEPGRARTGDSSLAVADGVFVTEDSARTAPVLEAYRGHYVLPGLVDMHTHLPADTPIGLTNYFGLLYLAHGVTSVREVGDTDGTAVPAAQREFEVGGKAGPRVFSCGPFVGGPNPRWANSIVLERPEDADAVVEELARRHSVCVKSYDDLDPPRIRALVRAASARGMIALGHVPYGLTFEEALLPDTQHLMGVMRPGDIARGDHVVFRILDWRRVDDARMDEVVRISAENGLAHTPTLVSTSQLEHFADYEAARRDPVVSLLPRMYRDVVWSPAEGIVFYRGLTDADHAMIRDAHQKKLRIVRKLHEAGVTLRLGTDTQQPFVVPGAALVEEVRQFAAAGIPLEEVWAYATTRAAATLGLPGLGTLAPGAPADFLVYEKDPTVDAAALDSLRAVVVGGRLYTRQQLDDAILAFKAYYASPFIDFVSVSSARRIMASTVQRDH